jgi:hypothetical protein
VPGPGEKGGRRQPPESGPNHNDATAVHG